MSLISQFSIQLWSVKDVIDSDFSGTLKKLAEMGYTGVEFAGYGGLPAQEMKQILETNGLKSIGSHIDINWLSKSLDELIEYNKIIGTEYFVCPYAEIKTKNDTIDFAKTLTPFIKKIHSAGFKFAYHNHDHEFIKHDGEYLLDILFQNLPPETAMELDVYWAAYAQIELFAYMEKHKDRLKLLHVKQIDENKKGTDIKNGVLNFREIITKAKTLGVEHFIMEQEEFAVSSMVSAKNNIDFIYCT